MSKRAHKKGDDGVYFCNVSERTNRKNRKMKTKIMIVEDSYTNRVLFKALLEELDMEVTEFSNGMKALHQIKVNKPDIILLDLWMPVMTGLEFLKELRRDNSETPVIVVSAMDDTSYIEQAYALGANEYLVKPVISEELIRRISAYIECEQPS